MKDDIYNFDEDTLSAVGKHGGKRYNIGEKIKVKVIRTSEEFREVDFAIV